MPDHDSISVRFLGSGTSMGVPVIGCTCVSCSSQDPKDNRLRSSILIQTKGKNIIIDSGPDFRYQVLQSGIKHLNGLVFTHEHKDHTAGMDDVRAFNFIQRQSVDVYATAQVEKTLRSDFHYAFADVKYPGVPEITIHPIDPNQAFEVDGVEMLPIQVFHHRLPVLGFRVGDFTYITDANRIEDKEKEKVKGSKVLVLNALRKKIHISHFTLDEALTLIEELSPERAYLTHISHQMGRHEEVSKLLPDNVEIAYDGLVVTV